MTAPLELQVRLDVAPARPPQDGALDVRGTVRNLGGEEVDVQSWLSELHVDGEPSAAWAWAIGNGLRDARESSLAPGEQVELRRVLPVAEVLPGPGAHELVLVVRGVPSPPVEVHVP